MCPTVSDSGGCLLSPPSLEGSFMFDFRRLANSPSSSRIFWSISLREFVLSSQLLSCTSKPLFLAVREVNFLQRSSNPFEWQGLSDLKASSPLLAAFFFIMIMRFYPFLAVSLGESRA